MYETEQLQAKKTHPLFPVVPPLAWSFPPEKKTSYLEGEKFAFGLTLFGSGIGHLAVLLKSLQTFLGSMPRGRRTGAFLQEARLNNPFSGLRCSLFSPSSGEAVQKKFDKAVITGSQIEEWAARQPPAQRFSLKFQTPLLLQLEEEKLRRPAFQVVLRALLRRISLLYYQYHGLKELDLDYGKYLGDAARVEIIRDQTRFVSWEQFPGRSSRPEGIIGEVHYEGSAAEYAPILKLGEFTNLGAGSTFGLGRYSLRIIHLKAF